MDRTREYIAESLELHLFFARIMKEHALFLKAGFLPPGAQFAKKSEWYLRQFETILSRAITLSDHVVRECVLECGEVVTEFTACAELLTRRFTGTFIDPCLTARAKQLNGRGCDENPRSEIALKRQVRQLNRDALALVEGLIAFKESILHKVREYRLFTANYPLLIEHILREAKLYRAHLRRLEGMDSCDAEELRENELFWNRIMMEHALFIRGLLDPTEEKLICQADEFAKEFKCLLETASKAQDRTMSCELTEKFRDFKRAGAEGLNDCKIRSVILPLLADHVLREANHYLRLLNG